MENQLAVATPAAEMAQELWFTLSSLKERMMATSRIATDRASSYQETAYHGADPEELEAKAARADAEYQELMEQVEIAAQRLETIREEVDAHEEQLQAADKEHLAQVRAIADRREGVVRLLAQEDSIRAQLAAAQAELSRGDEVLKETLERTRDAEVLRADNVDKLAAAKLATEPLKQAHLQAMAESEQSEKRLEQLRDQQRELERKVSGLESRIETLQATSPQTPTTVQEVLPTANLQPITTVISIRIGLEKALAAALGGLIDALSISELSTDQQQALLQAQLPRTL